MKCPKCASDNTQTIQMVCLAGSSSGSSNVVGVDLMLNIGIAKVGSQSQTDLASLLKPRPIPIKNVFRFGSIFVCCGLFTLIALSNIKNIFARFDSGNGIRLLIFLLIAIACFAWGIKTKRKIDGAYIIELSEWEKHQKLYETGWICLKCGSKWFPSLNKR